MKMVLFNRLIINYIVLVFIFVLEGFFIFKVESSVTCSRMKVLETGEISCKEILEILNVHNEMRESIAKGLVKNQPPASNMRELYWDEELANGAQEWANKCTFDHNSQKDREVARFKVGQNIAQAKTRKNSSETKEFRKQVNKWFDEHKKFDFGPIKNTNKFQLTGHYTQIVWANTYMIGCGFSRFETRKGRTHKLYVCHYGPTGNEVNESPYKTGTRKCPSNLKPSKQYPNLCSLKKHPPNVCDQKRFEKDHQIKSKFSGSRRFLNPSDDSTEHK